MAVTTLNSVTATCPDGTLEIGKTEDDVFFAELFASGGEIARVTGLERSDVVALAYRLLEISGVKL